MSHLELKIFKSRWTHVLVTNFIHSRFFQILMFWVPLTSGETFTDDLSGWNVGTSECGTFGTVVGGYNVIGGGSVQKTYYLPRAGCSVRVELDYIKIDSWYSLHFAYSTNIYTVSEVRWPITHLFSNIRPDCCCRLVSAIRSYVNLKSCDRDEQIFEVKFAKM